MDAASLLSPLKALLGTDDGAQPTLLAFFILWLSIYAYYSTNKGKVSFFDANNIHDFHSYAVIALATCSIFLPNEEWSLFARFVSMERVVCMFSFTYFLFDLLECILHKNIPFLIHAALSAIVIYGCGTSPSHLASKSVSLGAYMEMSTPLLHRWQASKSKADFLCFAFAFTCCRIIYTPIFLVWAYNAHGVLDYLMYATIMLYGLQLFWWIKILSMAFNYREKKGTNNGSSTSGGGYKRNNDTKKFQ